MGKIRALIIDDSVVVRKIVSDALTADPSFEVVGTAANGKIGLAKIPLVKPDVITLDVEMPVMNGLETLAAIRKTYPQLPVIMFSTLTIQGAASTLDALALGANDYVTKPANVGSATAAQQSLRDDLIPKIKAICAKAIRGPSDPMARNFVLNRPPISKRNLIDVLAIGVSTGGPNALCKLIPEIPADFPVPVLIVQHMPPMFTKQLAERLDKLSQIRVHEAIGGDRLQAGHAYMAPGDYHMIVKRNRNDVDLVLQQGPPENSCRPAVDVLFRSTVDAYGAGTLGVILTGMGKDGLRGCELIRQVDGQIIAQDEETSVVWGMPGLVAKAGLADEVLPLDQIGAEVVKRVKRGHHANVMKRVATCS